MYFVPACRDVGIISITNFPLLADLLAFCESLSWLQIRIQFFDQMDKKHSFTACQKADRHGNICFFAANEGKTWTSQCVSEQRQERIGKGLSGRQKKNRKVTRMMAET